MKIYDCFTFYNEFELLELRLKALYDVVDYFVIVEANRRHNGESKEFTFPKRAEEFRAFWPKIRYVNADLSNVPFKGVGDWSIENAQRNAIMHGLIDAQPDDLIFISDADEFWAPDILQRIQNRQVPLITNCTLPYVSADNKRYNVPCRLMIDAVDLLEICPIALNQIWHFYYFDWATKIQQPTTIVLRRKNLTTPQAIRSLLHYLPRASGGGITFHTWEASTA